MSNEMPTLEAGRHILVNKDGDKFLVMADGLFVNFDGEQWSNLKIYFWSRNITPVKVYTMESKDRRANLKLGSELCPLIWERDSKREALKSKYSTLMDKIEELTKQAEEIGEEL